MVMAMKVPTEGAPAARATPQDVAKTYRAWAEAPSLTELLDAVSSPTVVLNRQRQLVFANASLRSWLGFDDFEDLLGLRLGETLGCRHACEAFSGCGTTRFCRFCGALNATLAAQQGESEQRECRILRKDGSALDLRVWARPFTFQGEMFTVFVLMDTADEKRRRVLEKVFFHDVLNTTTMIRSAVELWSDETYATDRAQIAEIVARASHRLVEEITSQRDLLAAESGELALEVTPQDSMSMLVSMTQLYAQKDAGAGAGTVLKIADNSESVVFRTDARLLGRVLGNLIKNALEAGTPGDVVTVGCTAVPASDGSRVQFWVNNPATLSAEVRSQLFKRSFSTKGVGRGIGTYSVKLLTEQYLKGQVSFVSSEAQGTTFCVSLPRNPADA